MEHKGYIMLPTYEEVYELISYDKISGDLTWKPRDEHHFPTVRSCKIWNSRFAGKPALNCTCKKTGCLKGTIKYKNVYAHDVAWLLATGDWPNKSIYHVNGDNSDNRINNLAEHNQIDIGVKNKSDITPDILRDLLSYDSVTGVLTWKERPQHMFDSVRAYSIWNTRYAGKTALKSNMRGYGVGSVFGFDFLAHRVAWAIHYGKWPSGEIDHINGNPSDNRIENLRDVDHKDNMRNVKKLSTNTSGVVGVCWDNYYGKWLATIHNGKKQESIGRFDDFQDAVQARKAAEVRHGYHPNHGRGG